MKKLSSIIFYLTVALAGRAQTADYKFAAPVTSPTQSGLYNIALTPQLMAHLKTDLSDLRIVNDSGKWVPHALHTPIFEQVSGTLPVLFKADYTVAQDDKKATVLMISKDTSAISNLIVEITNTAAVRYCTLSGSNDSQNWFVINDSILLSPVREENSTASDITISFPPVKYKFLKLNVLNNNKDPFNMTAVFYSTNKAAQDVAKAAPIQNPPVNVEQKDSGKISYIKVTQNDNYQFSRLSIAFGGAKYFSRKMDLCIPSPGNIYGNPVQSFTVSNNSTLNFSFTTQKAKVFYLLIYNADNLPLKVSAVQTAEEYTFLSSYLEAEKSYRLLLDNEAAFAPDYDLAKTKLPDAGDSTVFLQAGEISLIEKKIIPEVVKKDNGKIILWSAIIGILLLLLFFTMKMLKEINKKKNDVHL